ncbi:hypothetical protein Pth03_81040 [Planotetraspora thailandica]|uniref:Uncharacterized protein n=1 Tax=Planotetraspora thailandica TaxID=487172 RepID=A0A8J4DG54_9ACTN|nr:hypothetical protein Pth03_81040 [Planotetraspora thailandica]
MRVGSVRVGSGVAPVGAALVIPAAVGVGEAAAPVVPTATKASSAADPAAAMVTFAVLLMRGVFVMRPESARAP